MSNRRWATFDNEQHPHSTREAVHFKPPHRLRHGSNKTLTFPYVAARKSHFLVTKASRGLLRNPDSFRKSMFTILLLKPSFDRPNKPEQQRVADRKATGIVLFRYAGAIANQRSPSLVTSTSGVFRPLSAVGYVPTRDFQTHKPFVVVDKHLAIFHAPRHSCTRPASASCLLFSFTVLV
jgi:hypothetical protein